MSTIAEILEAGPGKSVHLTARVKRAFDGKSGVGANGQWTRQDFELEDGTGTVKVEWWSNDLGKAQLQGQMVSLQPGSDGKGCYVKQKEGANGRPPSMVISCSGPGIVKLASGQAASGGSSGVVGGQSAMAIATFTAMPMADYLATVSHVTAFVQMELGIKDEQAVAAIVNTAMIAVTQGRAQGMIAVPEEPPYQGD